MAAPANRGRGIGSTLVISALLHVVVVAGLYGVSLFADHLTPRPQAVMTARIVRLGPVKDKKLLPTLAPTVKTPPPPRPAPKDPAPKPSPAPGPNPAPAVASRTQSALERLRKATAGAPDGDAAGTADDPLAGDRYTAEVERCMHAHYNILGVDDARKANRLVRVIVYIGAGGKVLSYRMLQRSGFAAFDDAVDRAVRLCPELPPPPPERREQLRRGGIEITFNP